MRTLKLIFIFIFVSVSIFSQKSQYQVLADSVTKYILSKDFLMAFDYSVKALSVQKESEINAQFMYNCAVLAAKNQKEDLGLYFMQQAVKAGLDNYTHASANRDFSADNACWIYCLEKIRHNASILHQLTLQLDSIYKADQDIRHLYMEFRQKKDIDSIESVSRQMRVIDSLNLKKVEEIVYKYGYYGKSLKSTTAQVAIFVVVLHSDNYSVLDKYFPIFREAMKRGEFIPSNLAYIEDRLLLLKCGKQKYGTQYSYTDDGHITFFPFIDESEVDKYRSELGLGSLFEYKKEIGF